MYRITYYGMSAFRIELEDGRNILVDPYLNLSSQTWQEMPKIDYIILSHGAGDHVGNAFDIAKRDNSTLVACVGVLKYAQSKGVSPENCYVTASGALRQFGDVGFKALASAHVSFMDLGDGRYATDQPLGYIIYLPDGLKIYHTGDTSLFGDMKMIGEIYQPDVALLPVGMLRGAITEMDPEEAAIAAEWINPGLVIPMHYDVIDQADHPQRLVDGVAKRAPHIKVRPMRIDETIEVSKATFRNV